MHRWIAVAMPLALAACAPDREPFAPQLQIRVPGDVNGDAVADLALGGTARTDEPASRSIELENVGASVIWVSTSLPSGDGAQRLEVDLAPFTAIAPEQRWPVTIRLTSSRIQWATGAWEPTLALEARYLFSGQAVDEPEVPPVNENPEPQAVVYNVKVTYDIDCDIDGDGVDAFVCAGQDCNDDDDAIHPGAVETCNFIDDDCDGARDEEVTDAPSWTYDADHDGYGSGEVVDACLPPATSWVTTAGDCDDTTAITSPGATEVCDGVDNDCDGETDERCP